jgi:hypothetical protein
MTRTVFDVNMVTGATALGMANPNSRTDALGIFSRRIQRLPNNRDLCFLLGEVDCGFLLWYQAQKGICSLEDGLDRSFGNYVTFLESVLTSGHTVTIISVPLPTIRDNTTWGGLNNARREVEATLLERTALTTRYNDLLRAWSRSRETRMVDLEPDLLDPLTHVVRERFVSSNPLDHHYAPAPFASVVVSALAQFGYS